MDKIYERLLNEALNIYDFDSWDKSQGPFKYDIMLNLAYSLIFKFKPFYGDLGSFKVINTGHKGENKDLKEFWEAMDLGPLPGIYPYLKFCDKVLVDGKRVEVDKETGELKGEWKEGEYNIFIEELESLRMYYSIFYYCKSLKEVRGHLPMKNIKTTASMFGGCNKLESIPMQDMSNVLWIEGMFDSCYALDEKTRKEWNMPKYKGTPGLNIPYRSEKW